jgi:hypothetical protein
MSIQKSGSAGEPFLPSDRRVLMVMSHPNHEAAVFGIVQRLRPRLVILTDGGGQARVEQSRLALERIGLLDRACFLNFRESDFYRALLDRDSPFFEKVVDRLREEIEASAPEQILCDAVEFYNPVHDLALPALYAALGRNRNLAIFEVPLIYQTAATHETYEIQRFPPSRRDRQIVFRLNQSGGAWGQTSDARPSLRSAPFPACAAALWSASRSLRNRSHRPGGVRRFSDIERADPALRMASEVTAGAW